MDASDMTFGPVRTPVFKCAVVYTRRLVRDWRCLWLCRREKTVILKVIDLHD